MYVQEGNKKGFATLIENNGNNQDHSRYRVIATVYHNKDSDHAFDIVPVKDMTPNLSKKNKKRSALDEGIIYHSIHKRSIKSSKEISSVINPEDDLIDYMIIPGI